MNRQVAILAVGMLALSGTLRAADVIDGVVAIVNSNVITYSQVMELVQPVDRELRRNFSGQELDDQRRKAQEDALNTLIEHALIVQEFDAKGYKIPETYVEGQINNRIATEFGGNRAAFIKTLEAENLTLSQFRDQERERIIIEVMRDQRARKTMVVSPYKIAQYYQDHIDQFKVGDQVKLRMIYVKRGEPVAADAVANGQDSASATNQAASTNSAAAAAVTNSAASTGSSTTTVAEATAVTNASEVTLANAEVSAAVSTTAVSGTATVVTNTVEVATTNGATTNVVTAAAVSDTNAAATAATTATTAPPAVDLQRKLAEEILGKLDAGDSFESLARVYSEGKEAKEGGDWGWIGRDILRKELNETAFSLKPGQHSRIIETAEGYYILEVDDVKPAHTTPLAEVRDDIEKTLLQQQRAQMQEQWVKDLRAKAYIRLF
ncbi:MAG: peptidyl-prolyl cis-trans isomerase [Verrucomicrobiia bacterium]